jgi:hypothetical protein
MVPWHLSRTWVLILAGSLGLFLLLCANEMFGEPPLMTPSLRAPPDLATAWRSAPGNVQLYIHTDASVTGTVGAVTIAGARIRNNRSWFGKLLHWRCDYRIDGRAGGELLFLKLERHTQDLTGWLWIVPEGSTGYQPGGITLRKE